MNRQFWSITIGLVGGLTSLSPVILAQENKASISYFTRSPRLVNVITTYSGARIRRPRYYYTINLPKGSGQPLKTISINQRQGFEEIDYYAQETIAFQGTPNHRENPLTIAESTWDKNTETMTIIFNPPVSPGTTFTVGVMAKRNPSHGGNYLFGVTAFPAGNNPRELYLGSGRLYFEGNDDGDFD
ncbi:DUF2808 domain-containing protein [Crocosphaera sp. Alani8]|uniref:DUF2808 domain-containing protein n=1 Tax=Crocosphaera sp. Alani8 TaxID=3038952 RepID=UPI00313F2B85